MRRLSILLTLILIVTMLATACSTQRRISVAPAQAKVKAPDAKDIADLSQYIRSVLKISQENTVAADVALKQLIDRRPELSLAAEHARQNPSDIESRRFLASACVDNNLYAAALGFYQEILKVSPNDAPAEMGIAKVWIEWGDVNNAFQHAERATVIDPKSVEALDLLGRLNLRANRVDQALSAFLTAVSMQPTNTQLLGDTGYAFLTRKDWNAARGYLERAVEADGSIAETHNNLGIVLAHLNEPDAALREFMAAGSPAAAFNNLGVVYMSDKRWVEARDTFRRALALDPGYAKARSNLAEVEARIPPPTVIDLPAFGSNDSGAAAGTKLNSTLAKDSRKKAEIANRPAARVPQQLATGRNARFLAAYRDGMTKFQRRRYQDAAAIFEWLLAQEPGDALASHYEYWLGESYYGLGRYADAAARFERVSHYAQSTKKRDALLMLKRAQVKQRLNQKTPSA